MRLAIIAVCLALAGCASRDSWKPIPPAAPVASAPEDRITPQLEAENDCFQWNWDYEGRNGRSPSDIAKIESHHATCQTLKKAMDDANARANIAALLRCKGNATSETCRVAESQAERTWGEYQRARNRYYGVVTYSCPDGWVLNGQACWTYKSEGDIFIGSVPRLDTEASCKLIGYVDGVTWYICQQPAKQDQ